MTALILCLCALVALGVVLWLRRCERLFMALQRRADAAALVHDPKGWL